MIKQVSGKLSNPYGFTLVELLIVIVIMGILAGIAVPMYLGQRTKAAIAECETNLQVCLTLEENFYAENGRYAPWVTKSNFTEENKWGTWGVPGFGDTLNTALVGWNPGDSKELNFMYYLKSEEQGQNFLCYCVGKGGPVKGIQLGIRKTGSIFKY